MVLALAIAAVAMQTGMASAKPMIVGPPFDTKFTKLIRATTAATFFNVSLAEPEALVTAPTDGAIVDVGLAGAQGGPYRLRILRPLGGSVYLGAGTSNELRVEPPRTGAARFAFTGSKHK